MNTKGLQRIEAALEFGAYAEIAFGSVARGYLYVMGGVFYSSRKTPAAIDTTDENGQPVKTPVDQLEVCLEIYVRFGGSLSALSIITISIDVHLGLRVTKRGSETFAEGRATLSYSIKIGFFKKSFSVTYSKSFAGSRSNESAQQTFLPANKKSESKARQLQMQKVCPATEGGCGEVVSCVDAIGDEGFRAIWYCYGSALAA